jgi:hypothetical protein
MLLDLLGGRRNRVLTNYQATVGAIIVLLNTINCSGPRADLPPPIAEIVDQFPGTETPKKRLVQRDKARPKTSQPPAKKASAPPKSDAQSDEQLYQEFLEWQKNQKGKQ